MKALGESQKRSPTSTSGRQSAMSKAAIYRARLDEEKQRDSEIYGPLVDDVRFLRQRGFAITRDSKGYDIGRRIVDADGLRALAARERRLLGEPVAAGPSPLPVFKPSLPRPRAAPRRPPPTIDMPPAPQPANGDKAVTKTKTKDAKRIKPAAGLADPGAKPRLGWLKLSDLKVDAHYQRNVKKDGRASVNRMAREFSWRRFTPLVVAPIDGTSFAVVDGQHRLLAARKRGDILELPCCIIDTPDVAEQAGSFVSINRDRIQVGRLDQFHASIAARDPAAQAIEKVCKAAGIAVSRVNHPTLPPVTTTATMTLAKMLKLVGETRLVEALQLLRKAKPQTPDAFRSAPIAAMARLIGLYDEKLDRKRVVATLEGFDLDDELARAKGYRAAAGGTLEDALLMVLVRAYNKRGRAGALQEPQAMVLKAAA